MDTMDRTRLTLLNRATRGALPRFRLAAPLPLLFSLSAGAAGFTADFSSPAQWDTTTTSSALWNTVDQRIQAAISANGTEINFGTGSLGAFSDGPAQNGITVVGATITFDTNTNNGIFNFTSFKLSSGKTILATGPNPLTIRVLGATDIQGTIDVSGAIGTPNASAAGTRAGGLGGVAGGSGGNSGFGATAGSAGLPGSGSSVFGGSGGATAVNTDKGGGGGCNGSGGAVAGVGNGVAAAGGAAGICGNTRGMNAAGFESSFTNAAPVGGGGGGGGGDSNGAPDVTGGGGGGGGGAIRIVSLDRLAFISPTGNIFSRGGSGGANSTTNGTNCGGGGGGGAGGSIWLQSAKAIGSVANPGNIDISGGSGGTDGGSCVGDGDGGAGSLGVLRVDSVGAPQLTGSAATLTTTPAPLSGQTYEITSKAIDTGTSSTVYSTPVETLDTSSTGCGNAGSLHVTYAGATNGTTFGTPVDGSEISSLNGNRYIRFKVTITTAGTTPPCLKALSIPYTVSPEPNIDYKLKGGLACGSTRGPKGGKKDGGADLALILAAAGGAALASRRSRKRSRVGQ